MVLVALVAVIFITATLIVRFVTGCDTHTSIHICLQWIKECIREGLGISSQQTYPVLLGWNSINIVPELAEEDFKDALSLFDSSLCINIQLQPNLVIYTFSVMCGFDETNIDSMKALLYSKTVIAVTKFMRQYGCYVSADALTSINLQSGNQLFVVSLARNDDGIKQIREIKAMQRNNKHLDKTETKHYSDFTEDWNNER